MIKVSLFWPALAFVLVKHGTHIQVNCFKMSLQSPTIVFITCCLGCFLHKFKVMWRLSDTVPFTTWPCLWSGRAQRSTCCGSHGKWKGFGLLAAHLLAVPSCFWNVLSSLLRFFTVPCHIISYTNCSTKLVFSIAASYYTVWFCSVVKEIMHNYFCPRWGLWSIWLLIVLLPFSPHCYRLYLGYECTPHLAVYMPGVTGSCSWGVVLKKVSFKSSQWGLKVASVSSAVSGWTGPAEHVFNACLSHGPRVAFYVFVCHMTNIGTWGALVWKQPCLGRNVQNQIIHIFAVCWNTKSRTQSEYYLFQV